MYSLIFFSFLFPLRFNWLYFRRIYFYPKGSEKDGNLTIVWEAVQMQIEDVSTGLLYNVSKEWSRDVKFKLVVFNQLDTNRTITKGNCFILLLIFFRSLILLTQLN
jgi:hypothetical protein